MTQEEKSAFLREASLRLLVATISLPVPLEVNVKDQQSRTDYARMLIHNAVNIAQGLLDVCEAKCNPIPGTWDPQEAP